MQTLTESQLKLIVDLLENRIKTFKDNYKFPQEANDVYFSLYRETYEAYAHFALELYEKYLLNVEITKKEIRNSKDRKKIQKIIRLNAEEKLDEIHDELRRLNKLVEKSIDV